MCVTRPPRTWVTYCFIMFLVVRVINTATGEEVGGEERGWERRKERDRERSSRRRRREANI